MGRSPACSVAAEVVSADFLYSKPSSPKGVPSVHERCRLRYLDSSTEDKVRDLSEVCTQSLARLAFLGYTKTLPTKFARTLLTESLVRHLLASSKGSSKGLDVSCNGLQAAACDALKSSLALRIFDRGRLNSRPRLYASNPCFRKSSEVFGKTAVDFLQAFFSALVGQEEPARL